MPTETKGPVIRDARPEDVPILGAFKEGETFHRDRLRGKGIGRAMIARMESLARSSIPFRT